MPPLNYDPAIIRDVLQAMANPGKGSGQVLSELERMCEHMDEEIVRREGELDRFMKELEALKMQQVGFQDLRIHLCRINGNLPQKDGTLIINGTARQLEPRMIAPASEKPEARRADLFPVKKENNGGRNHPINYAALPTLTYTQVVEAWKTMPGVPTKLRLAKDLGHPKNSKYLIAFIKEAQRKGDIVMPSRRETRLAYLKSQKTISRAS